MDTAKTTPATGEKLTPMNTAKVWGKVDDIEFEGFVQGPAYAVAPLQIACVFEYIEGDIYTAPPALPAELNGMVHLDKELKGLITDIRSSGKFEGHAFETLLLKPPAGMIGSEQLLLIGLGDRNVFKTEVMKTVSKVAMREALRLGITHYSFGSDIKDGGFHSETGDVAGIIVEGAVEAYRTQQYLKSKSMSDFKPVTKVTLLAGMAFFVDAGAGIAEMISKLNGQLYP
jgi:hypothetical protein